MEIILGAAASVLVQVLKNTFKTSEYATLGVLLLVSFGLAALYSALVSFDLWDMMYDVLLYAGAIYTFILARFQAGSTLRKMID